ncbi:MAG: Crp/Fnr family transcriptional regulator [Spirochaetia bacterium]|nr:Crp/Fnr family transcriptional regulator [Spirochaetia bacterium]
MNYNEILEKVPYFDKIDNIDTFIKDRTIKIKNFVKNNTIREINEECNFVDIVVDGKVIAYSLSENGNATTMFEFKRGSIIGANMILTGGKYPLNFYSEGQTQIISISKTAIEQLLKNYDFTIKFFKALSINSQNLNQKVFMFHKKTIRENLIKYFNEQSIVQKSKSIVLPISKKELADYLGIQRQSLFRELKKMKDEEIISINNKIITLL